VFLLILRYDHNLPGCISEDAQYKLQSPIYRNFLFLFTVISLDISQKGANKMTTKNALPLFVLLLAVLVSGCGITAQAATNQTPREVVGSYYNWYLNYIGDPATEEFRNPLVDRAYRDSQYISASFISQVDDLLADPGMGRADPFLCAQDIPTEIIVGEARINGEQASVPLTTSFANHHITVSLEKAEGSWRITGIQCQ
jgi:hypothetical protein